MIVGPRTGAHLQYSLHLDPRASTILWLLSLTIPSISFVGTELRQETVISRTCPRLPSPRIPRPPDQTRLPDARASHRTPSPRNPESFHSPRRRSHTRACVGRRIRALLRSQTPNVQRRKTRSLPSRMLPATGGREPERSTQQTRPTPSAAEAQPDVLLSLSSHRPYTSSSCGIRQQSLPHLRRAQ